MLFLGAFPTFTIKGALSEGDRVKALEKKIVERRKDKRKKQEILYIDERVTQTVAEVATEHF